MQNATQKSQKVFVHVPSEIAAHEVEEIGKIQLRFISYPSSALLAERTKEMQECNIILGTDVCSSLSTGVEHLLRDVKDTTISTLATEVSFNPYFISFHV